MTSSLVLLPASLGASFLLSLSWPCPLSVPACNWEAATVLLQAGKPARDKVRDRCGEGRRRKVAGGRGNREESEKKGEVGGDERKARKGRRRKKGRK